MCRHQLRQVFQHLLALAPVHQAVCPHQRQQVSVLQQQQFTPHIQVPAQVPQHPRR